MKTGRAIVSLLAFQALAGCSWPGTPVLLLPPRPLSPLSGSIVAGRQPVFQWELRGDTEQTETEIEFCRDRNCTQPILSRSNVRSGERVALPVDESLSTQTLYWRLWSFHGIRSADHSPVWRLVVHGNAAAARVVGHTIDTDGNGESEIWIEGPWPCVGIPASNPFGSPNSMFLLPHGTREGDVLSPIGSVATIHRNIMGSTGGDYDGDGLTDLVVGSRVGGGADVLLSAESSARPTRSATLAADSTGNLSTASGDFDGDGYADIALGIPDADSVEVFTGGVEGPGDSGADVIQAPDPPESRFGASLAHLGQLNDDAFGDVLIGAPGAGKAYVFLGLGHAGTIGSRRQTLAVAGESDFGARVVLAGDLNRDGIPDAAIAAPSAGGGNGRVYLFLGSGDILGATPIRMIEGTDPGGNFGSGLAAAGDVDGDGFDDLLVGAPLSFPNGDVNRGRAWLIRGWDSASAPAPIAIDAPDGDEHFGQGLAGVGDLNRDGYADVVIGAPITNYRGDVASGIAHVYLGSATGLSATPAWTLVPPPGRPSGCFGHGIAF